MVPTSNARTNFRRDPPNVEREDIMDKPGIYGALEAFYVQVSKCYEIKIVNICSKCLHGRYLCFRVRARRLCQIYSSAKSDYFSYPRVKISKAQTKASAPTELCIVLVVLVP